MRTYLLFIGLVLCFGCQQNSPKYTEVLDLMKQEHQTCLDTQVAMTDCSYRYYEQMDSMLNVVYKDLMSTYSKEQQDRLKQEERAWLKERDKEFARIDKPIEEYIERDGRAPTDERMFAYGEKADITRRRVEELIRQLERK